MKVRRQQNNFRKLHKFFYFLNGFAKKYTNDSVSTGPSPGFIIDNAGPDADIVSSVYYKKKYIDISVDKPW